MEKGSIKNYYIVSHMRKTQYKNYFSLLRVNGCAGRVNGCAGRVWSLWKSQINPVKLHQDTHFSTRERLHVSHIWHSRCIQKRDTPNCSLLSFYLLIYMQHSLIFVFVYKHNSSWEVTYMYAKIKHIL